MTIADSTGVDGIAEDETVPPASISMLSFFLRSQVHLYTLVRPRPRRLAMEEMRELVQAKLRYHSTSIAAVCSAVIRRRRTLRPHFLPEAWLSTELSLSTTSFAIPNISSY